MSPKGLDLGLRVRWIRPEGVKSMILTTQIRQPWDHARFLTLIDNFGSPPDDRYHLELESGVSILIDFCRFLHLNKKNKGLNQG